ncbi:hypothetical protein IAE22_34980, partial [Bacillus sp. S34]|nr:hypothetical protein [Bacillus sp. S34]
MPELHDGAPARRRQWGSERRTRPLDTLHERPSDRKLVSGRVATDRRRDDCPVSGDQDLAVDRDAVDAH